MSQRHLAVRAAVVAATLATTATVAVLPATTVAAAPTTPAVVTTPVAPAAQPVRAAAGSSAVRNALGKIGAPYRYGASGPSAFDCSGLVHWAFKRAGVTVPRTSRALASAGVPVSRSDLRPGDIVLFYRPVSHAAIYVGGGQVVHASTNGKPVKLARLDAMPFHSARRV